MLTLLVPLGTATLALLIPLSPVSLALLIPPSLVVFMLLLVNALPVSGLATFYPSFCRLSFSYNHHLHCISPAATHLSFQPFLPKRTPGIPNFILVALELDQHQDGPTFVFVPSLSWGAFWP